VGTSALAQRFQAVRARSGMLCAPLEIEDYGIQAMENASPPKWHLAHTTWFFETFILIPFAPGYPVFAQAYAHLFNSYYETAGTFFPRRQRSLLSRPTVAEVYRYRQHVDAALLELLAHPPAQHAADILQRVQLGIEHEIQHQELLLMDTLYNFSVNPLLPAYHPPNLPAPSSQPPLDWQTFKGGLVEIGHDGVAFAYDNERPCHKVWLDDFRLATRLTSNAEYLAFIEDDGYRRVDLWLSDGWHTVNTQGWQAPLYWFRQGKDWMHFDLTGAHPLREDEPVSHLSYYEADACARWAGKRLPTEAEWEHAASTQSLTGSFLDSGLYVPQPATLTPTLSHGEREKTHGHTNSIQQMYGELWQWTQSAYLPYPGFKPLPGTLGEYNGKFMCDQWVLRGGCCVSPQDHLRVTYRNFFRAADRWMFSGLRLAEDA